MRFIKRKAFLLLFAGCGIFLLSVTPATAQIVLSKEAVPDSVYIAKDPPSVKLSQKSFPFNRKLYQNLVTRDNYYFNARQKFRKVMADAGNTHENRYDSLLSFYPFSLEDMNSYSGELDSIILKTSIGIEIHDPRGKWIDDLYMLAGKAYLYKKDFPNAIAAFQYINKHFAPKTKEDETPVIGSRGFTSQEQISIATPEKKNSLRHTPSRNEALLWLAHTYIYADQYDKAQSLLNVLTVDPNFPQRLKGRLAELEAFSYYRQGNFLKCLSLLSQAEKSSRNKELNARWAFLAGQLYEQQHSAHQAVEQYQHVLHLRPDPLMGFYARLNIVRVNIQEGATTFQQGSKLLLDMARKEKYERYRGRIYFALAQLAIQADLPDDAQKFLTAGTHYNRENTVQLANSFKLLAEMNYNRGHYIVARQYYDSTAAFISPDSPDAGRVQKRKTILGDVVTRLETIYRQDSLQMLAALPPETLQERLQKIVDDSLEIRHKRQRRAEQMEGGNNPANDLLAGAGNQHNRDGKEKGSEGDWYFYNNALKSKGFTTFRSQWGNLKLADNWRKAGTSNTNAHSGETGEVSALPSAGDSSAIATSMQLSVESLMIPIPTTPEKRKISNDSLIQAYYDLGGIYADRLENPPAAIHAFDTLLKRFPDNIYLPQTLYRLYLLYSKTDKTALAAHYLQQLRTRFPDNELATAKTGKNVPDSIMKQAVIHIYDSAYIHYLSGDYAAVSGYKSEADSLYPTHELKAKFDLLQAMAVIKTQPDSAGMAAIGKVIASHAGDDAVLGQATAIQEALRHKNELIEHLSKLQLPENTEDSARQDISVATPPQATLPQTDTATVTPPVAIAKTISPPAATDSVVSRKDTAAIVPPPPPPKPVTAYKVNPENPYFVVLSFNRTDKELIETGLSKFAAFNLAQHAKDTIEVSPYVLKQNRVFLIFRLFKQEKAAQKYFGEIKAKAASIIPGIRPQEYSIFFISRDNFILLNNTKDYEGYIQFFNSHYAK